MTAELYKIGLVARMTQVTPERLRQWERRYSFAPAAREGQTRFYSADQIERIKKISALAEQGHGLAQLMQMDQARLDRRLERVYPTTPSEKGTNGLNVLFIGNKLRQFSEAPLVVEEFDTIEVISSSEELFDDTVRFRKFDVIAIYQSSLDCEEIKDLSSVVGGPPLVTYRLYTDDHVAEAMELGVEVLEWSKSNESDFAVRLIESAYSSLSTASRFSNDDLTNIAKVAIHDGVLSAAEIIESLNSVQELEAHVLQNAQTKNHKRIGRALHTARQAIEDALEIVVVEDELLVKSAYLNKHESTD